MLYWFDHVEGSSGVVRADSDIQVDGRQGLGMPKMTCKQLTQNN